MKQKSNWTDSDELALMFHNTYQPSFYKHLHRYVHKNFRKHIAYRNLQYLVKRPLQANRNILRKALSTLYLIPSVFISELKLKQLEKLQ